MVIRCAKEQLKGIEEFLFSWEGNFKPSIDSIVIHCDDKIYYYKFDYSFDKYRIITI